MRIDIWSDYVCPFCTVGGRHLELALEQFPGREDVEVVWRSFQLDPTAPTTPTGTAAEYLVDAKGMSPQQVESMNDGLADRAASVGLDFNWRASVMANTFDAHRLSHLARTNGRGPDWDAVVKRAYFTEGHNIADPGRLRVLGDEVGLEQAEVDRVLADPQEYAGAVAEDIATARRIGVRGVPFFVFDGTLAVSGAQPVEAFTQALTQAAQQARA